MSFSSKFSARVRAVIVAGMLSIATAGPAAAQDIFGLNEAFDNFLDGVIAGSGMDPNSDAAEAAKDYGRGALTGTADPDSVAEHAFSGNGPTSPGNAPAVSATALCDRILMPADFECTPTGDGRVRVAARARNNAGASAAQREARNPAHDLGPYSGQPESERQACLSGDLIACDDLADRLLETGKGVQQRLDHALSLAQFSCEGGQPKGCQTVGYIFYHGKGVARDYDKAMHALNISCDGGFAGGCSGLGAMFEKGNGVQKDNERAVELFIEGCDGGHMFGCSYLGYMFDYGLGVRQDRERAVELYEMACSDGDPTACSNLAKYR